MNVCECLKRQLPQRPLPDTCKDHIAQLHKADGQKTRRAICQSQANSTKTQICAHTGPFWGHDINSLAKELRCQDCNDLRRE